MLRRLDTMLLIVAAGGRSAHVGERGAKAGAQATSLCLIGRGGVGGGQRRLHEGGLGGLRGDGGCVRGHGDGCLWVGGYYLCLAGSFLCVCLFPFRYFFFSAKGFRDLEREARVDSGIEREREWGVSCCRRLEEEGRRVQDR